MEYPLTVGSIPREAPMREKSLQAPQYHAGNCKNTTCACVYVRADEKCGRRQASFPLWFCWELSMPRKYSWLRHAFELLPCVTSRGKLGSMSKHLIHTGPCERPLRLFQMCATCRVVDGPRRQVGLLRELNDPASHAVFDTNGIARREKYT